MNINDFESINELKAWAKVNGYDAGGIEVLCEMWKNRDTVEVIMPQDHEE